MTASFAFAPGIDAEVYGLSRSRTLQALERHQPLPELLRQALANPALARYGKVERMVDPRLVLRQQRWGWWPMMWLRSRLVRFRWGPRLYGCALLGLRIQARLLSELL